MVHMELIEIIKSSLSIFLTAIIFFIMISYTIFKIKNRSLVKSDLNLPLYNNDRLINPNNSFGIKISNEKTPLEKVVLIEHPLQNRFKIINEDIIIENSEFYQKEKHIQNLISNVNLKNNYDKNVKNMDLIFR
jgi:hypothetical protein